MDALQVEVALEAMKRQEDHDEKGAVEFGWRVHDALDSWTGKVDTKASIALAIETAIFGFVISMTAKDGRFAHLHGADLHWFRLGLGFLVLSVLLSMLVVMPQLNRRKSRKQWRGNMIYFGHLRHWDPADLAKAMGNEDKSKEQLAKQLVAMSKITWRKHAWLQWSLGSLIAGSICLFLAT